jgi:hypothetical protein
MATMAELQNRVLEPTLKQDDSIMAVGYELFLIFGDFSS